MGGETFGFHPRQYMEQEVIKGVFGTSGIAVLLLATGPVFGLLMLMMVYRSVHFFMGEFVTIQRQQQETLNKLTEMVAALQRDVSEVKETVRDSSVKLHVLEEKVEAKTRTRNTRTG